MKDKTRLEYLDAAKGLGILLVILGHIYAWNPNINRKILDNQSSLGFANLF